MRTRTIAVGALAAALLVTGTSCSSYSVEDCQKAINDSSTKTSRPKECEDLSQDDYETVLLHWAMKKGISEMDPDQRDMLDYYDDGSINGSISED